MACCSSGHRPTPLELHARSLAEEDDCLGVKSMRFPMYTIPSDLLLQMTKIEPHEVLKERGDIVVFDASMGKAVFVSHQWVALHHPDPQFKQMRVLQGAVRHLLSDVGFIPLDPSTEVAVPTARRLPLQEFKTLPLYLWYDYISCPQLEQRNCNEKPGDSDLAKAIESIPSYITRCSFFFALCPVIDSPDESRVLTPASWGQRSWCRLERAVRELSTDDTWILIRSETSLEIVGSVLGFMGGSAGEGEFTEPEDREKFGPVLKQAVMKKLLLCLKSGDFAAYRRHLNLQGVYFRRLSVGPVCNFIPGFELKSHGHAGVAEFFYQNGFTSIRDIDSSGWSPLHYAALCGDTELIESLLQFNADPSKRTTRDQPKLGCPPWTSALDLSMLFKHNDAARLLLAARAKLQGGVLPAVHFAAISDNAAGIRLLCSTRCDPLAGDLFGTPAISTAAGYGSMAALEELVFHARRASESGKVPGTSHALFFAMAGGGGSAEMVHRLLELQADVNHQMKRPKIFSVRILVALKALQHRFGRPTAMSKLCHHWGGITPLMAAMLTVQYEGAAALIAAGARLDLKNDRNWTASTFAMGHTLPHFIRDGLLGDVSECERVAARALAEAFVEI